MCCWTFYFSVSAGYIMPHIHLHNLTSVLSSSNNITENAQFWSSEKEAIGIIIRYAMRSFRLWHTMHFGITLYKLNNSHHNLMVKSMERLVTFVPMNTWNTTSSHTFFMQHKRSLDISRKYSMKKEEHINTYFHIMIPAADTLPSCIFSNLHSRFTIISMSHSAFPI